MTGQEKLSDRYWPTAKTYALGITCADCGLLAWSCPCAVADNAETGQGDDGGAA